MSNPRPSNPGGLPKNPCEHCGVKHRKPTPQQEVFAAEYLLEHNATKAFQKAYEYKGNNITERGYQVLHTPTVQCLIHREVNDQKQRLNLDADTILGELLNIATVDIAEAYNEDGTMKNLHDMPVHLRKAIAGFESDELTGQGGAALGSRRKLRFHGKIQAAELLGKRLKLWTDVVQHEGLDSLADSILKAQARAERHSSTQDEP